MINVKYIKPTKLACPQEILISFRYKQSIVDAIRLMPDRYYDAKNREWHLSYDCLSALQKALPDEEFNIEGKPIDNKRYGEKIIEKHYELPKELKTKLYSYQEEGFNEMMNFDKFLLLDSPGCISGDMIITANRSGLSRKYTMRQIYAEWNRLQECGFDGDFKIRCLLDGYFGLNSVENVVYSGDKDVYELQLEDGYSVEATLDHKILTDSGYRELQDIKVGDIVICNNVVIMTPKKHRVLGIRYVGVKDTYDIQMQSPYNNFIANGVVVHNCGKSITAIATALKRKELNGIKHCLIVCGVNSIKFNWQEEILTHAGMDSIILGARKNKKGVTEVKSNKDKLEDLNKLETFFIITNIETFRDKTIKEKLKKLVDKNEISMIVFDECHKCKAISAQQTKGLMSVAKNVRYFYGLTGTVLSNSPLDAFVPLKLVEKENANFTNFKSRYCVYGGWGGFSIVGYRHLDELQAKLNMVSLRRTKEDVLDLPPKTYTVNYVELNTKQRKIYNDVMKSILEHIDEVSVSPSPLSQLIRLRQATADTSILSSTIQESAKFERLDEILEEQISNNEKVVVFSNWTTVTDRLVQRYAKYNPAVITGEIKDRQTQKDKFMTDDSCKLLIGTISAMGTGLTLTVATTAVFVDEPYTWANYEQASDRIYRIGQKKNVTIISLLAKDTIDERVHKIMLNKKHISEAIVDNQYNLKDRKILEWLIGG